MKTAEEWMSELDYEVNDNVPHTVLTKQQIEQIQTDAWNSAVEACIKEIQALPTFGSSVADTAYNKCESVIGDLLKPTNEERKV